MACPINEENNDLKQKDHLGGNMAQTTAHEAIEMQNLTSIELPPTEEEVLLENSWKIQGQNALLQRVTQIMQKMLHCEDIPEMLKLFENNKKYFKALGEDGTPTFINTQPTVVRINEPRPEYKQRIENQKLEKLRASFYVACLERERIFNCIINVADEFCLLSCRQPWDMTAPAEERKVAYKFGPGIRYDPRVGGVTTFARPRNGPGIELPLIVKRVQSYLTNAEMDELLCEVD